MRIGTWNLANHRGKSRQALQHEMVRETSADIFVLTEVNAGFDIGPSGVRSTPISERANTSWVAIVGDGVTPFGDPRSTTKSCVAGRVGVGSEAVIVVGSVLPWKTVTSQAPELREGDETYIQMFKRLLNEHGDFVRDLQLTYSEATVVWAGDFNQSLSGSNIGASNDARELLSAKLKSLGLVAYNEHMAHAYRELKAIDLICGPASRPVLSVERIDPLRDENAVSDHAGYVVELNGARQGGP